MSKTHSTPSPAPGKPAKPTKPYEDFPLFTHGNGQWAKKIRGKLHYFGLWDDPDAALAAYLQQKDALHRGRTPRPDPHALTVKELVNAFLNHHKGRLDTGELSPRSWQDYKDACDEVVSAFGKGRLVSDLGPADFAALRDRMSGKWGHVRLGNVIQRIRSVFKYAYDAELTDRAVRFGPGFKRPSQKTLRLDKVRKGAKPFTAEEIRKMLDAAGTPLRAMLLLGTNCGFGNSDCGNLPLSALDLEAGVIDFPRPKTGIPRRCVLWPETIAAVKEALAQRPEPKDATNGGLCFITKYGLPWAKDTPDSPVAKETAKLLKKLGVNGRKGLGFYTLRHTFRTVAYEAKDQPAADYIMGHEVPHMSSIYRETIADARLRAVAEHVRQWLFGV